MQSPDPRTSAGRRRQWSRNHRMGTVAPDECSGSDRGHRRRSSRFRDPYLRDGRVRSVAEDWTERRIDSPMRLRFWVEKKGAWSAEEVATRLAIPLAAAEALLTALGYELSERGLWEVSDSQTAQANRARWDGAWMREVRRQLAGPTPPLRRSRIGRWLARLGRPPR